MIFHVKECGPDLDAGVQALALERALKKAAQLSKDIILAVNTKEELHGFIEKALGESAVKKLKRENVAIARGRRFKLITGRAPLGLAPRGPIVCAYVLPEFLREVIRRYRQCDVIYIPWTQEELTTFLANYMSQEI